MLLTLFLFVHIFFVGEVTRTKKRKSLTDGVSYRRVRQLEIHCKVEARKEISCHWFFAYLSVFVYV